MDRIVSIGRSLIVVTSIALIAPGIAAHAGDIEGTWRLTKRVLPDGTVITPPAVAGIGTAVGGVRHLNVFWLSPEGRPGSYGLISRYRLDASSYTETIVSSAFDDGSGNVQRGVPGDSKTFPVTREGGRLAYQLPFDPPKVVYEGDVLTATMQGQFVDYCGRVK